MSSSASGSPSGRPTDLARAAINGKDGEVRRLLSLGIDPNAEVEYGGTSLIHAAGAGHVAIVGTLLDAGSNTEATT